MLTQICQWLRNWFDYNSHKERLPYWEGEFAIENGVLVGFADRLLDGQYYRIQDSLLNDGVHQWPLEALRDEVFTGTVQCMSIPPAIIELADDISTWAAANAEAINSPYQSESFGGYSYTLRSGNASSGSGNGLSGGVTWQSQFAAQLAPWRKI